MKLTQHLKSIIRLTALLAVSLSLASQSAFAKDDLPGVGTQPATYFYTGKPYDSDLGSYTFNARNYNPEINRWTSADPSGFPDGANANRYCVAPTFGLDPTGLEVYNYNFSWSGFYNTGGNTSNLMIAASASTAVASLATSGSTSLVFSAISTAAGFVTNTPNSWSLARNPTVLSGWGDNGAPPSGGTYQSFNLAQVFVEVHSNESVYFPTSDTSGSDFFAPWDQGNLAEILNSGHFPSPEQWAQYAPSGLAYPGTTNSYSASIGAVRFAVNFSLSVE